MYLKFILNSIYQMSAKYSFSKVIRERRLATSSRITFQINSFSLSRRSTKWLNHVRTPHRHFHTNNTQQAQQVQHKTQIYIYDITTIVTPFWPCGMQLSIYIYICKTYNGTLSDRRFTRTHIALTCITNCCCFCPKCSWPTFLTGYAVWTPSPPAWLNGVCMTTNCTLYIYTSTPACNNGRRLWAVRNYKIYIYVHIPDSVNWTRKWC